MGKYDGLKKVIKKHVKDFGKTVENIIWRLAEEQAEEIAKYLERCQKSIAEGEDECEFCIKNEIGFVDDELGVVLTNAVINHENEMLQDPSANILIMEGLETLIIKAKRFDEGCDVEEYFYNTLKRVSYVDDLILTIKLSPDAIKHMDAIARAGKRMKDESGFDLFLIYMSDDIVVVELERRNADSEESVEEEKDDEDVKVEFPEPIKYKKPSIYDLPVPNPDAPVDKELLNSVNDVFRGHDCINAIREGFDYLINKYQIASAPNLPNGVVSTNIVLGKSKEDSSTPTLLLLVSPIFHILNDIYRSLNRNMIFIVRCFDGHLLNISIVDTDKVSIASKLIWDNEISRKLIAETDRCELFIQVPNIDTKSKDVDLWDYWIIDDAYDKDVYYVDSRTPIFFDDMTIAMCALAKIKPDTIFEE